MRFALLALVTLVGLFWFGNALLRGAGSFYGWNLGPDGATIMYVTPGAAVWRAGIRSGDRIDWRTLPLLGRANLALDQAVPPNAPLRVTVGEGTRLRAVTLLPERWSPMVDFSGRLATFGGLVLLIIGAALVYLKPSRMTWGLLLGSLGAAFNPVWAEGNASWFLFFNVTAALLSGAAAGGILIFMSRFPADKARGPLVILDKIAIPLGVVVALLNLYAVIDIFVASVPPPIWIVIFNEYIANVFVIVTALVALLAGYALAKGSDRQRIVPVLIAFALFVASSLGSTIYASLFTDVLAATAFSIITACSAIAFAAAVANGVVRHRVVDVSFAISRTVVYTILTSILVGAFVLIDFISNKVLEHLQVTLFLEAAAALAFGIGLNSMHSRIDRFVDRTLFRRRYLAEKRLRRTSKTLTHAESLHFIDEALVIEACDALDLASAALFRLEGTAYVHVLDRGWEAEHTARLARDDHLVVNLMAELQPVDLADVRWPGGSLPGGLRQPLIAIPLVARHEMLGFVLYGGHNGGEAIDPDERQTLVHLADAATTAYEHVQSKSLLAESNVLRSENALLHGERDLLREMVEALRGVTRRVEN